MTSTGAAGPLILGVDGGGTKTAARIASVSPGGDIVCLGEGSGGPSNMRAVGPAQAKSNLDAAIDMAHRAAGTGNSEVAVAVLALAAGVLPDVQDEIKSWAAARKLARHLDIVHDALPLLALAKRDGRAVGLVVGTGSVAIGVAKSGAEAAVGGWGYWMSDKGSAWFLGREALAAIADAVDGIGASTSLEAAVLEHLSVDEPRQIVRALTEDGAAQKRIAAMAPLVMSAAALGDEVAVRIVQAAADAAASLVKATIDKLQLDKHAPLAMAGGVACSGAYFQTLLLGSLKALGVAPETVIVVSDPVEGSLVMARDKLPAGTIFPGKA
ncbi:MAG TPA: BadF/BadG/BcrA/BcrD ATPase family protein [Woeseiaceae bacterium]|nr:BadF/BadG/BcrA/BcrD ATPase family protein [Woeseiaceae bacterium]